MTPAHHIEAVLSEDGKLSLEHLPFTAGQTVDVTLVPVPTSTGGRSLKDSVLKFDRPTDPVAEEDWDVLS